VTLLLFLASQKPLL